MQEKKKINVNDLERKQVYSVPEDYFEQLPGKIGQRIHKPQPEFRLLEWPVVRYGMAVASLCLILFIGYTYYVAPQAEQAKPEAILAQVSGPEIIQYLQQAEVSQYELVERVSNADIVLENSVLDEVEIDQEILLEETDYELIEELI